MKNSGKSSDKTVLVVLAILIVAVVVVLLVVNLGKQPSDGTNTENNGENVVENEVVNGPAISGTENVSVNGEVKTNVSDALKKTKTFEIYTLTDISLESVSGSSTLTATVSADVASNVSGKPITIKFYDRSGNLVETMGAYMPQVKPGETSTLSAQSTTDLANAYDFVIESK